MSPTTADRRDFLALAGAAITAPLAPRVGAQTTAGPMFGLISKMTAVRGHRDALAAILIKERSASRSGRWQS